MEEYTEALKIFLAISSGTLGCSQTLNQPRPPNNIWQHNGIIKQTRPIYTITSIEKGAILQTFLKEHFLHLKKGEGSQPYTTHWHSAKPRNNCINSIVVLVGSLFESQLPFTIHHSPPFLIFPFPSPSILNPTWSHNYIHKAEWNYSCLWQKKQIITNFVITTATTTLLLLLLLLLLLHNCTFHKMILGWYVQGTLHARKRWEMLTEFW
jgi:hypothetical protein